MAGGSINWYVVVPDATRNLVTNPSFEFGTAGWAGTATPTLGTSAQDGVAGAWAAQFSGATLGLGIATGFSGAVAGGTYVASAYVRMRGTSGGSVQISVGGTSTRVPLGTAQDWTRVSVGSVGAVGSVAVQRYSGALGTLWVDAVQVEASPGLTSLTTYIDGDQAGGVWEGAPHASASYRGGQARSGGTLIPMASFGFRPQTTPDTGMWPLTNILQSYAVNAGAEFQRSRATERTFTLTATPTGTTLADLHVTRREIIDALKIERVSPPQPTRLYYTGATGTTYIDALYDAGLGWGGDNVVADEDVAVRFVAPDPAWYGVLQEGTTLAPYTVLGSVNYVAYRDPVGQWGTFGVNGTTVSGNSVNQVRAVTPFNGTLFVGGVFYAAGGTRAHMVAQYAGGAWGTLSGVLGTTATTSDVVYTIYPTPSGTTYVGGVFPNVNGTVSRDIGRYTNGAWGTLSGGTVSLGGVTKIIGDPTTAGIYVGGGFVDAGGATARGVVKWSGAWSALGGGTVNSSVVWDIALRNDQVLGVVGDFTTVAGTVGTSVAFWRNNAWGTAPGATMAAQARAITIDPSQRFYAAGTVPPRLYRAGDNVSLANIIGDTAFTLYADSVGFVHMGVYNASIGTIGNLIPLTFNYAVWNGYSWLPPDLILSVASLNNSVFDIAQDASGTMYFGGGFSGIGTAASITPVVNSGIAEGYPTLRMRNNASGTARIYQLLNTTTGDSLWFNYVMAPGEIAALVLTPGNRSFTSSTRGNIFGVILGGSNIASWRLLPGTNTISFFADNPSVQADLYWNPRSASIDGGAQAVL